MTDKSWWHARCAKSPWDKICRRRARELYPDMFYDDGGLVPADMVNFKNWDRRNAPAKQSAAYQAEQGSEA